MEDEKKKFNPLGGDWLMGKAGKSEDDKSEETTEESQEESKAEESQEDSEELASD